QRRDRPTSVQAASGLWLAAVLVWLLAVAVGVVQLDDIRAALTTIVDRDFPGETPGTRESAVTITLGILLAGPAVIALLQAWAALALRAGRGGARIVLVLLAVLAVGCAYFAVAVAPPVVQAGLVAGLALMVAGAVAMLLPGARPWFRARRR
ncbi:MAG: hypothetical protein L0H64_12635, partial [Pseudonocardia sp.]|nr:hypothetical protein [Pseudonocardia sp.]